MRPTRLRQNASPIRPSKPAPSREMAAGSGVVTGVRTVSVGPATESPHRQLKVGYQRDRSARKPLEIRGWHKEIQFRAIRQDPDKGSHEGAVLNDIGLRKEIGWRRIGSCGNAQTGVGSYPESGVYGDCAAGLKGGPIGERASYAEHRIG